MGVSHWRPLRRSTLRRFRGKKLTTGSATVDRLYGVLSVNTPHAVLCSPLSNAALRHSALLQAPLKILWLLVLVLFVASCIISCLPCLVFDPSLHVLHPLRHPVAISHMGPRHMLLSCVVELNTRFLNQQHCSMMRPHIRTARGCVG